MEHSKITSVILMLIISIISNAQTTHKQKVEIQMGTGIGWHSVASIGIITNEGPNKSTTFGSPYISAHYFITHKFSAGVGASFTALTFKDIQNIDIGYNYEYLPIFLQGSYHFFNKNKFTFYAAGRYYYTQRYRKLVLSGKEVEGLKKEKLRSFNNIGAQIGGNYFFHKNIGIHAEVGYPYTLLSGGLNIKF